MKYLRMKKVWVLFSTLMALLISTPVIPALAQGNPCLDKTEPIDVVVVMDLSGSMSSAAEDAAKAAANNFIDYLDPLVDRVGFVGFAVFPGPTVGLTSDFANVQAVIASASNPSAFFGTDISWAIQEANSYFAGSTAKKAIILLSDGYPNLPADPAGSDPNYPENYALTQAQLSAESGITFFTIGYDTQSGASTIPPNEAFLTDLASLPEYYFHSTEVDFQFIFDQVAVIVCTEAPPIPDDVTPPEITIVSPVNFGMYDASSGAPIDFSVADDMDENPAVGSYINNVVPVQSGDVFFGQAGAYIMMVSACDYSGNSSFDTSLFMIYDSNAEAATGGGWFYPDGMSVSSKSANGKATFGFVAEKDGGVISGNLEFQYHGDEKLDFKGSYIDSLYVSGNMAEITGTGTINHGSNIFPFKLTVVDNGKPGKGKDAFQLMIWDGSGSVEPAYTFESTIDRGNIVVHQE